jgi:2-polyprenyl-3-methyl-5-hydroxy-6-metoxy-1,4-benzoquinol methylase
MEKVPDWNSLWRELVEIKTRSRRSKNGRAAQEDVWEGRAIEYKEGVKRRWECPDSSRDFILSQLDPGATVLDIGAGTGSWAILMAGRAKHVTAVEPSTAMIKVLREGLAAESITNVSVVQGLWMDVSVKPHDFSLCSHAMYGTPDLEAFVLKMVSLTKRMCFLILRAATLDGVRAEAARHIWKQPLDSPNFTIAYNVLIQAGIYANVLMENTGFWKPKTSPSLEEAMRSMKRYLGLGESGTHNAYLMELLERRLTWDGSQYLWPPDVRSALIYWRTDAC